MRLFNVSSRQRKYTYAIIVKGFTMMELLLYLGVLSILMGVLANVFSAMIDVQLESDSTSSVHADARYIQSRFHYDIHRADSISSPTIGNDASSLTLVINSQSVTYSIDAEGDLILTTPTTSDQLNSYDTYLGNVTFHTLGNSINGNNTVQITYTIHSKTTSKKGEDVKSYTTTVGLR